MPKQREPNYWRHTRTTLKNLLKDRGVSFDNSSSDNELLQLCQDFGLVSRTTLLDLHDSVRAVSFVILKTHVMHLRKARVSRACVSLDAAQRTPQRYSSCNGSAEGAALA